MRIRRHLVWSIVSVVAAVSVGELFARCYLGLGTPPLSVSHPTIEYMYKPNQDVYRFGNHFIVNQYGMRSVPFTTKKGDGEYRVMVFGDSVLNGGSQTDHAALATAILQDEFSELKDKNVVVGNISAPSWGPGNWLAYAREYGFFGADVVALVISSHDYADKPSFRPLNKNTQPTEKPISALLEGITRYLPRYLPNLGPDKNNGAEPKQEAQEVLDDLGHFLELAKTNSADVLVFQHWEKSEIESGSAKPGNRLIKAVCEQNGISPISLEPYFRQSLENGADPYRDDIHPNKVGQQLIAQAILANRQTPVE